MSSRIVLILGSTRRGRQSPKVARAISAKIKQHPNMALQIVDLDDLQLPIMEERLKNLDSPPQNLIKFAALIDSADGIIIVSPEYNRGYPGVLKNTLDYLTAEYENKKVGIVCVSSGPRGGTGCLDMLTVFFKKMKAIPLTESFVINNIEESFSPEGVTAHIDYIEKIERLISRLESVDTIGTIAD